MRSPNEAALETTIARLRAERDAALVAGLNLEPVHAALEEANAHDLAKTVRLAALRIAVLEQLDSVEVLAERLGKLSDAERANWFSALAEHFDLMTGKAGATTLLMVRRATDYATFTPATASQERAALEALVASLSERCYGPKGSAERRLARDDDGGSNEETCGQPARWGIITAWTCDEHRRPEDVNEIGSAELKRARAVLRGES